MRSGTGSVFHRPADREREVSSGSVGSRIRGAAENNAQREVPEKVFAGLIGVRQGFEDVVRTQEVLIKGHIPQDAITLLWSENPMIFNTYYWRGYPLGDPALEAARHELADIDRGIARRAAFEALLRSDTVAAIGTALDHFAYAASHARHGGKNIFESYAREVADRARTMLALPASEEVGDTSEPGGNHRSALGVLQNLAGPEDAEALARLLATTDDDDVRREVAIAAEHALAGQNPPHAGLMAGLTALVLDDRANDEGRLAALRSVASADAASTELLLKATTLPVFDLQAMALLFLLEQDLELHRPLARRVSASWPANATEFADDVLSMLGEAE